MRLQSIKKELFTVSFFFSFLYFSDIFFSLHVAFLPLSPSTTLAALSASLFPFPPPFAEVGSFPECLLPEPQLFPPQAFDEALMYAP